MDCFKKNKQFLIFGILWFSLVASVFLLSEILLPFLLATLLAYVLAPLVDKMSSRIPRFLAVLILYSAMGILAYLFSTLFLPELYQELLKLAKTSTETLNSLRETNLRDLAVQIESYLAYYQIPIRELDLEQVLHNTLYDLSEFIRAQSSNIVVELQALVKGIVGFVFSFFLVLMIAGFILVDVERIKSFMFRLVPSEYHLIFKDFLFQIDTRLSGVVRGQLTICMVNASLTLLGLLLFQVKYALILATLAGIFSLIPIFGSIISTIPIALVALMNSPWTCLLAILWIIGIHAIEANFLNPKILGSSAQIHPVLVVLALIAGEHFYGIPGALLAVPIASISLTLFQFLLVKAHPNGESSGRDS